MKRRIHQIVSDHEIVTFEIFLCKKMSGDPSMAIWIPILFCLAFIYGFLVINIPIGLFVALFRLARHPCLESEYKEQNLKLCLVWLISAIPICGPILAINQWTK